MGKIVLVVVVIVFFLGLGYFNSQVAEACTHGNCVHGWDSKYTYTEQRYFQLWLIGFPILAYFIVYHFADEGDEIKSESNPKKSNLRSNKVRFNPKNVFIIKDKKIYQDKTLENGEVVEVECEPNWGEDDANKNE